MKLTKTRLKQLIKEEIEAELDVQQLLAAKEMICKNKELIIMALNSKTIIKTLVDGFTKNNVNADVESIIKNIIIIVKKCPICPKIPSNVNDSQTFATWVLTNKDVKESIISGLNFVCAF